MTFSVNADSTYYIIVDGHAAVDFGDYHISVHTGPGCDIQCGCPYPNQDIEPGNNTCGYPTNPVIHCGDTLCGIVSSQDNVDHYVFELAMESHVVMEVFGDDTPGYYPFGQGLDPQLFFYYPDCSGGANFVFSSGGVGNDVHANLGCFPAGTYDFRIGSDNVAFGPYILIITCEPCSSCVDCPVAGIPENEPCPNVPDNFNAGCDSDPPAFTEIECGQTICGTFGPGDPYDLDVFKFSLDLYDSIEIVVTTGAPSISWTDFYPYSPECNINGYPAIATGTDLCEGIRFVPKSGYLGCFDFTFGIATTSILACYEYTITLHCFPFDTSCDVVCPPNALIEGEPCPPAIPDYYNGGCDVDPPAFIPIECGVPVCGTTYKWDDSTSDHDFYSLTLDQPSYLTFTLLGETGIDIKFFPIDENCQQIMITETEVNASTLACWNFVFNLESEFGFGEWLFPPGNYSLRVTGLCSDTAVCYDYLIQIDCTSACIDSCPDWAAPDNEPCPNFNDTYNGGCSIGEAGNYFSSIDCGDFVCGTLHYVDDTFFDADHDWYLFEVTESESLTWCASAGYNFEIGIANVTGGCANADTIQIVLADSCNVACASICIEDPGTYGVFISAVEDLVCGEYTAWLDCRPCQIVCDGIPENEPCPPEFPDSTNWGCDGEPPYFTTIQCNSEICGTTIVGNVYRDKDWYKFTITEPQFFYWCVEADFPFESAIYQPGPAINPCLGLDTLRCAEFQSCTTDPCVYVLCEQPGDYYAYIAPQYSAPAGVCLNYRGNLYCQPCTPSVECPAPDSVVITYYLGEIILSWPPVAGVNGYRIYRSTVSPVAITPANFRGAVNTNSFTDDTAVLEPFDKFFYTVVGYCNHSSCP